MEKHFPGAPEGDKMLHKKPHVRPSRTDPSSQKIFKWDGDNDPHTMAIQKKNTGRSEHKHREAKLNKEIIFTCS